MIKQIIIAVFLGTVCAGYIAQYDTWIQQLLLDHLRKETQTVLDCRIACKCSAVSFVQGQIDLYDVFVTAPEGHKGWYWKADQFRMNFSWWHLLLYGTFDFCNHMKQFVAYTQVVDNTLAIEPHLYLLFEGPNLELYTFLKKVKLEDAHIHVHDEQKDVQAYLSLDVQAKKIDNCMKATIDLHDGQLKLKQRILLDAMAGALQMDAFDGRPYVDMCLRGAASVVLPQLGSTSTPCTISCAWQHNRGLFSLKNIDHSFVIDPVVIKKDGAGMQATVHAKLPLAYVWRMLIENNDDNHVSGSCDVECDVTLIDDMHFAKGHMSAQRIKYDDIHIGSLANMTFDIAGNACKGDLYVQRTSGACGVGSWQWDLATNNGSAVMKNSSRLTFSPKHDWRILPEDFQLSCQIASDGQLQVNYKGHATHSKTQDKIVSSGTIVLKDNLVQANGLFDDHDYSLQATLGSRVLLHSLCYHTDDPWLSVDRTDVGLYHALVNVVGIKEFIKKHWQLELQGQGVLQIAMQEEDDQFVADLHLADGVIRLPRTYNFINGFDCRLTVDPKCKKCTVQDLLCTLHNGRVSSSRMHIDLANDLSARFVYAPLLFEHCLLNMGKELFATVSGDLLFSKTAQDGTWLKGKLFLDRAQLKENLFSDVFQKNMRTYGAYSFDAQNDQVQCDLRIKSKHPVRVQTPFLKTDARIDVHVTDSVRNPTVTGSIHLNTGQLNFPYKPLYITKGALHFMPGKLDDPLVELVAKNNIKKNNIMLQVGGSLKDPHVTLESSPSLNEEQIVSLLLVGSQEESLNMVMPALLMQNVTSLLFGYDQTTPTVSKYFGNLLKPFRRIHLVPSFIDQSGRGGLRGAIEIDISDRWRAIIQKNFSLTEDTRFELEYLFSDDISVRAVRDIRRDLIGEVETRLKFGQD